MPRRRVLIPLPSEDFEPTEAALPWKHLRNADVEVVFATPDGKPGACDPLALEGVVFGQIGAKPHDADVYREMEQDYAFTSPIRYDDIAVADYDGLHLPGGHAPGMKPYLESKVLQARVGDFFAAELPVSAVCHGPVLLARSKHPDTGRPVLAGRRMTALTKMLERSGYWLTMFTLGRRFRTYPEYVQDEVIRAIGDRTKFDTGPFIPSYGNPFTVTDGNLITGRWPGDTDRLGREFAEMVTAHARASRARSASA